uniref:Uncharacterized protein n=1 Tax=Chlamydomonas euryale TaxID=1486919 RepID=A0A7R9V5Q3_9CHLO|mmetsp:Transcript_20030/g.59500  ORF Transcript_20030/g.59500 Transcript_20030/m.59500 type:complete len:139 (+) Transcript_20030:180-596(+)
MLENSVQTPRLATAVYTFSLYQRTWQLLSTTGDQPSPRYGVAGGIFPGTPFLYISHGLDQSRYSDAYTLNILTKNWEKLHGNINSYEPFQPHTRCLGGGAMATNSTFFMNGGCLQDNLWGVLEYLLHKATRLFHCTLY